MSETKWTAGPWRVDPPIGAEHAEVRDKDGRRIAIAAGSYPMQTTTEDANANLIAAAPDLYEALEAFVNNSSVQVNQPYECERAEAALAKAREKQ